MVLLSLDCVANIITFNPRYIRYRPPAILATVNAVAGTANRLPKPRTDRLITDMSPRLTAATKGRVLVFLVS